MKKYLISIAIGLTLSGQTIACPTNWPDCGVGGIKRKAPQAEKFRFAQPYNIVPEVNRTTEIAGQNARGEIAALFLVKGELNGLTDKEFGFYDEIACKVQIADDAHGLTIKIPFTPEPEEEKIDEGKLGTFYLGTNSEVSTVIKTVLTVDKSYHSVTYAIGPFDRVKIATWDQYPGLLDIEITSPTNDHGRDFHCRLYPPIY